MAVDTTLRLQAENMARDLALKLTEKPEYGFISQEMLNYLVAEAIETLLEMKRLTVNETMILTKRADSKESGVEKLRRFNTDLKDTKRPKPQHDKILPKIDWGHKKNGNNSNGRG